MHATKHGLKCAAFTLLGLVALCAMPTRAFAFCQMTTTAPTSTTPCPTTGFPLVWKKACVGHTLSTYGLPEFLDASSGQGWTMASLHQTLQAGYDVWNAVMCDHGHIQIQGKVLDATTPISKSEYLTDGANVSAIIFRKEWSTLGYDNGIYAVTTDWHVKSTGEILDSDMEINQPSYLFFDCTVHACHNDDVDLLNVLTHESGHTWGLGHSLDNRSTMFASAPPGQTSKRDLALDDDSAICAAYPPGTLPAACDFAARDNTPVAHHCSVTRVGAAGGESSAFALFGIAIALVFRRRLRA